MFEYVVPIGPGVGLHGFIIGSCIGRLFASSSYGGFGDGDGLPVLGMVGLSGFDPSGYGDVSG